MQCEWNFKRQDLKAKLIKNNDFDFLLIKETHNFNKKIIIKRKFKDKFTAFDLLQFWGYKFVNEN
jgi:hypothetical protein